MPTDREDSYKDCAGLLSGGEIMEGERTDMLPSAITFIDNRSIQIDIELMDSTRAVVRRSSSHLWFEQISSFKDVIGQLCYTSQRCHKIPEALVKLYGSRVHSLDLSYNELVSLKGLERFSFLRELVLDNNHLADSIVFPYLPHLHTLSLNKNQINDIELLMAKISHNLPALTFLSLLGNKACPNELSDLDNDEEDYQRYRYYVLHHAPSLKYLDSTRVTDSERAEANRRGQFMKIVRPKEEENHDVVVQRPLHSYTPLPRNIRNPDDHRGAYSKCKYKYSGKHSEGNRFISNKDL